jgi:hypothetical protein
MNVQKSLAVALIVALLVGLAIPVLAAETKGKIAAVRPLKNELVVTENFKNLTFQVNNGTRIYLNDLESKLADLQPGDDARVAFEKEGQHLIATVVHCRRK